MIIEKYAGTQAIARTFQLLHLFDDDRPIWSLSNLIETSGLKRTTVFRLLAALEGEGLVRKTESGDYTLGPGLIALGGRAIRANPLRTIAQPFLKQLVHETAESVTIDVLWLTETGQPTSLVVEEMLGQRLLGMSQFIGGRFPAHTTSTGKVLLAYQSAGTLGQLNFDPLEAHTEHTVIDRDQFQQELIAVREQGFATTINELEIGLSAVAAPIFNHQGEAQAALCIGGPSSRLTQKKLVTLAQAVIESAHQISAAIGFQTTK